MKYTVIWEPDAANELARLWLDSTDRQTVADAANEIDRLLSENPFDEKYEVVSNAGAIAVLSLGVDFEVNGHDMKVLVSAVWHAPEESE
ncbi:MAG: hypothetical protein ACR2FY_24470 [Pirellulaceae bacterium]